MAHVVLQICRTWLNIAEAHELDGATYETVKESYDHAMESARKAQHPKLQVKQLCGFNIVFIMYVQHFLRLIAIFTNRNYL